MFIWMNFSALFAKVPSPDNSPVSLPDTPPLEISLVRDFSTGALVNFLNFTKIPLNLTRKTRLYKKGSLSLEPNYTKPSGIGLYADQPARGYAHLFRSSKC